MDVCTITSFKGVQERLCSRVVQEPSFQVIPRLSYKGMQVSVIGSLRYSICTTKYLCGLIFMDVWVLQLLVAPPDWSLGRRYYDCIIFLHISSLNLGWWVFATLCTNWWMYYCPDVAPDSANPTNRYGINCCKTWNEFIIDLVSMWRLGTGTIVLHATLLAWQLIS